MRHCHSTPDVPPVIPRFNHDVGSSYHCCTFTYGIVAKKQTSTICDAFWRYNHFQYVTSVIMAIHRGFRPSPWFCMPHLRQMHMTASSTVCVRSISSPYSTFYCAALYAPRYWWMVIVKPSVRLSVRRMNCDETKAPSEKSSIITNRKSVCFPMRLTWTAYVPP